MFDSVRQIVESRLLSIEGSSYDTVVGDTLSSIVIKNPVARDRENLKVLNPTFNTFDNNVIITFGANDMIGGAGINFGGFPAGFLKTDNTDFTFLSIHNGTINTVEFFDKFLIIRTSNKFADIGSKLTSWANTINSDTVNNLGFTAETDGISTLTIIPKDRANNSFIAESLSIGRTDSFSPSLDHVYLPPITWIITPRQFSLFLEGRQYAQPPNEKFSVLMIQDASSVGREFGNVKKSRRHSGSVRIKLYAPHGTGTKIVRDMADVFDTVLAYTAGDTGTGAGGTLFMKAGSLSQVSENTDGFLEYNLDYIYDYYTS